MEHLPEQIRQFLRRSTLGSTLCDGLYLVPFQSPVRYQCLQHLLLIIYNRSHIREHLIGSGVPVAYIRLTATERNHIIPNLRQPVPSILSLKSLSVAPHRHPLGIKPQMQLRITSLRIAGRLSVPRGLSVTWGLAHLRTWGLAHLCVACGAHGACPLCATHLYLNIPLFAQYRIIKIYPVIQRRHEARMSDILHFSIDTLSSRIILMHLLKLLDISLIILPRQQLCQDNSQPFTTRSNMCALGMLLHHLRHHLPAPFVLDGLGIKQPVIHFYRIFLQVVAVDKEQSCIHCSLSTSRTTVLIPCSPCHHRQHLLSWTDILARLLQLCYLSHTILGLL